MWNIQVLSTEVVSKNYRYADHWFRKGSKVAGAKMVNVSQ